MGFKSTYDINILQQILSDAKCRAINDNGRVFPPSDEVYQTISKLMADKGLRITPKHVHTIINNNRHGFRDYILKTFDVREQDLNDSINDFNVTKCVDESTDTQTSSTSIDINLVISEKNGILSDPKRRCTVSVYIGNCKEIEGWADVIAEAIWVQHHLDCVFVFKNNNVYRSTIAKYFLIFEGFCRECSAKICGILIKEPAKNVDVILKCHVDGITPIAHSGKKRRQLRGARRLQVADFLIDTRADAVIWRRKEAGRIKKFRGKNPSILPSNETVRKAKKQRLLDKYGLKFANPAMNLLKSAERYVRWVQTSRRIAKI